MCIRDRYGSNPLFLTSCSCFMVHSANPTNILRRFIVCTSRQILFYDPSYPINIVFILRNIAPPAENRRIRVLSSVAVPSDHKGNTPPPFSDTRILRVAVLLEPSVVFAIMSTLLAFPPGKYNQPSGVTAISPSVTMPFSCCIPPENVKIIFELVAFSGSTLHLI